MPHESRPAPSPAGGTGRGGAPIDGATAASAAASASGPAATDAAPAAATTSSPLSGLLILDKPLGMTSMRAVEIVRRHTGTSRGDWAKTGHAGTLDPLATGVLIIAIGRATRTIEQLMGMEKRYESTFDLSAFTATDDTEAPRQEIVVDPAARPTLERIRSALHAMVGTHVQRPPAFSAVKVEGKRSYAGARKALRAGAPEQERPAGRPITIYAIDIVSYEWPRLSVDIRCGRGTYVRSIARDLGEGLGTGGHCLSIRRRAIGPYTIDGATTLDALPERITAGLLLPVLPAPAPSP